MSDDRVLYFLLEGPSTLMNMCLNHIQSSKKANEVNVRIAKSLGASNYVTNDKGIIWGVDSLDTEHFSEFTKAGKFRRPKKKSKWAKEFEKLTDEYGYDIRGRDIAEYLKIPSYISYENGEISGNTSTSRGFHYAGFLFPSEAGPYCFWIPNVPKQVRDIEAESEIWDKPDGSKIEIKWKVNEEAKNFVPVFEGARQILEEEWNLIIAQYELDEKRRELAQVTTNV